MPEHVPRRETGTGNTRTMWVADLCAVIGMDAVMAQPVLAHGCSDSDESSWPAVGTAAVKSGADLGL
jgi:hypothetical protein